MYSEKENNYCVITNKRRISNIQYTASNENTSGFMKMTLWPFGMIITL